MKLSKNSKALICFPVVLSCVALVSGCHSTKSDHAEYSDYSGYSGYSDAGMGASSTTASESSTGSTRTTEAQTQTQDAQGQVAIPLFEEQLQVGTRKVESGSVRLRKQITTETVNHPVQIRKETLVVDREAAPSGQAASQDAGKQAGSLSTPFEQGEIVIQLHTEEPVVETRIVPSGRIVVKTRTNTEQMNVQREVRREKIDVEKTGNPQNVIISENVGAQSGQSKEAVGNAPADRQQIQGQGNQKQTEDLRTRDLDDDYEPFPRPQPDGRETFPQLNKNPQRQ